MKNFRSFIATSLVFTLLFNQYAFADSCSDNCNNANSSKAARNEVVTANCSANSVISKTLPWNYALIGVDTLAIAACLNGCFPSITALQSELACKVLSATGLSITLAGIVTTSIVGSEQESNLNATSAQGGVETGLSAAGTLLDGAGLLGLDDQFAEWAGKKLDQRYQALHRDEEAAEAADPEAAEEGTSNTEKVQRGLACVEFAIATALLTLSVADVISENLAFNDNCKTINSLSAPQTFLQGLIPAAYADLPVNSSSEFPSGVSPADLAVSYLKRQRTPTQQMGAVKQLLNELPNSAKIPNAAAALGVSADEAIAAVKNGGSVFDYLKNKIPMTDAERVYFDAVKSGVDQGLAQRKAVLARTPSSQTSASTAQTGSSLVFGAKMPASNLTPVSANSGVGSPDSTDIFHSRTSDNLFQIVSTRITRSLGRVSVGH